MDNFVVEYLVSKIKEIYENIDSLEGRERELLENLACTVEHYEKKIKK